MALIGNSVVSLLLFLGVATQAFAARQGRRSRTQQDCVKCSPGSQCLGPQLICDFSRDCPDGKDEAETLCRHASFGSSYIVSLDDPISVHASDNKPIKVASTNTWFSLFRFNGPTGSEINFDFTDVSFTDNTKRAGKSYITTGTGTDPADASAQIARMAPGALDTPSGTHAFSTGSHVVWLLVAHPKGEKVDFSVRVSAVSEGVGEPVPGAGASSNNVNQPACFCVSEDLGCVEQRWVCDGTADCDNGEDEMNCPCDGFTCSDEKCIPHGFHCDGIIDCSNDEENCAA